MEIDLLDSLGAQHVVPANNPVLIENVALAYTGCYVQQPWVIS
jgi:hypothetical protein